jgi:hypothetical protein
MNYDGLERLIDGKINDLKNMLETSTYGEIKVLNENSIDVYLPSRDITLLDVPVFTLQGRNEYLQFPLMVSDKVLICFTKDSAIDWISGNEIDSEFNFGLENSFALVGLDTLAAPLKLTNITTLRVTKIKIHNDTAELITTLSNLLQELINTTTQLQLLTVISAPAGSESSTPVNSSNFGIIQNELIELKSQIDSFKE